MSPTENEHSRLANAPAVVCVGGQNPPAGKRRGGEVQGIELNGTTLKFRGDLPTPEPQREGDVIVDVLKAGICETDLQLRQGYMGFQGIPGHEFVGVPRSGEFAGRRVVGEINCPCGGCSACAAGLGNHCPTRTVVGILNHNGAFAEQVVLPEANLHALPDNVSTEAGVFVEPVAAACRIAEQVDLSAIHNALVFGDGRLGNLCAQVLKAHSVPVRVIGKHAAKLDVLQGMGIDGILLDEFQPERAADLVVDATGSPRGLEAALRSVTPCGTVILKTTVAGNHNQSLAPVVIDEVRVIGSRCGPFAPAIRLLSAGTVQVEPMISDRYCLSEVSEAFEAAQAGNRLKVLFEVS